MPITHAFTSPKVDGADATLVRPSNWNAGHVVTGFATDTDLTNHAAAADPHTGYQKESEKGANSGYPALDAGGFVIAPAGVAIGADTSLYRSSANILRTDDSLIVAGTIYLENAGNSIIANNLTAGFAWVTVKRTADSSFRFSSSSDGVMAWGDGTATYDTNLYRSAANELKTDDSLVVVGTIKQATTKTVLDTDHEAAANPHAVYALDTDLTTHAGAADPHTGYQRESEKAAANGYASLGADTLVPQDQLGTGTQDGTKFLRDDGTWQAPAGTGILASIVDVKGDIIVATAADTVARKAAGANDTILMADSAQADGLKWVASQAPSTQAFADGAAEGTADTYARGDHKHAMPADPVTTHAAAGDPHTGYRLESADHTHGSTGVQAGQLDHGSAMTGLGDDDHPQYVLEATAGISGTLALTADISPTDTGAINDWAPTGIGTTSIIRWNGGSAMTLSGITGGADGRVLFLQNVTSTLDIFLTHDTLSTAANRFYLPGSTNMTLGPRSGVILVYDSTLSRWRPMTPVTQSNNLPVMDGAANAGIQSQLSRSDHVHPFSPMSIDFSQGGVLAIGAGLARWYNRTGRTLTFDSVTASVGTAPTGASIIVDVHKNGTTIYTTQANRPTIAVSTFVHDDTTAPNVTTIADNEYLTIDVDQVGSTIAGTDLTVQVWLRG